MGLPTPTGNSDPQYVVYILYQPKNLRLCRNLQHTWLQPYPFSTTWYQSNCAQKNWQPSVLVSSWDGWLVYRTINGTLLMCKMIHARNIKCPQHGKNYISLLLPHSQKLIQNITYDNKLAKYYPYWTSQIPNPIFKLMGRLQQSQSNPSPISCNAQSLTRHQSNQLLNLPQLLQKHPL